MNDQRSLFVEKKQEFLNFLKTRYSVFHESNVFFRDLHYGVMAFLEINGFPKRYASSEILTEQVIKDYEESKILLRIDSRTWMVNYPPFKKPLLKPAVAAKTAPVSAKPAAVGASSVPTPTLPVPPQQAQTAA
jgi:hypothetical protein